MVIAVVIMVMMMMMIIMMFRGLGVLHRCRWISAPPQTSMGCWGTAALPWSAPKAAGVSLLWHLGYFSDLYVCRVDSLTYTLSYLLRLHLLLCNNFFPLLKYAIIYWHYYHHWWGHPWPRVGPPWSWLTLTLLDSVEASTSLSQKPPL